MAIGNIHIQNWKSPAFKVRDHLLRFFCKTTRKFDKTSIYHSVKVVKMTIDLINNSLISSFFKNWEMHIVLKWLSKYLLKH